MYNLVMQKQEITFKDVQIFEDFGITFKMLNKLTACCPKLVLSHSVLKISSFLNKFYGYSSLILNLCQN